MRVRWGYRRLHVLLKREGFQLGLNQTYRWYCLEQLQLSAWRKKRRKMAVCRKARMQPRHANDAWCMDFVADQLADGTKIRLLTIIDIYSREALTIVYEVNMSSRHSLASSLSGPRQNACSSTMAVNLPDRSSTCGLTPPHQDRFQQARQADGQLLHRDVQRIAAR